jgi:nitrate/TMAO reductase-like tetraheme cytochrome c subunit/mono/diheme cytochrome c family protein
VSDHDLETESNTGPADTAVSTGDGMAVDQSPQDKKKTRVRKKRVRKFFRPPSGSSLWLRMLPYLAVLVIVVGIVVGVAYAWQYTNSPSFCGTTCHTMPPEYAAYQLSPHSQVKCVECHIGRDFILSQVWRKTGHLRLVFLTVFKTYEYPIYAKGMRPAPQICEKCHSPAKFSNDSLISIKHYQADENNTPYTIDLIMHTGGGTKREGLGYGIHWHIENKVQFVSTDSLDQNIPYIRVTKYDGTVEEYVDVTMNFDTSTVDKSSLKTMDCITCHNRVTHTVPYPDQSVDSSLARGVISTDIPYIRREGVAVLNRVYRTQAEAFAEIAKLDVYYRDFYPDFYATGAAKVKDAIAELQRIYSVSVFADQDIDWTTHPNNVGHINSAGCFRCHDGKHLNANNQAIRLECNLCHSIPIVTGPQNLVTRIEIVNGPEPASHLNANWISLHNQVFDSTCANCHTVTDPGGTSNTSFCSNSACHGTVFTYAGFDAPALREILKEQLPAPTPVTPLPSASDKPTYESYAGPLFNAKCGSCHGSTASAGLNLTTYASAIKGASDGPVIVPGDSAHSKLVEVQSAQHFANLSAEELQTIEQWIDAGAPEK